ncbi:MAG: P-type Ca2+ transporter type [Bacillota bacterium]|nr:P-type Ca2+ transporter type [Bacillota bacterium]
MNVQVVHRLPGRLRIDVPGLRRNAPLAARLRENLTGRPEIKAYEVSTRTGRLLIYTRPGAGEKEVLTLLARLAGGERCPAAQQRYVSAAPPLALPAQAALTLAGGGALLGLALARLARGPGRGGRSRTLYALHAVATALAGYPIFAGAVRSLGRLSGDVLLSLALLGTLTARESLLGLAVATLVNLNGLLLAWGEEKGRRAAARPAPPARLLTVRRAGKEIVISPAAVVPGDRLEFGTGSLVSVPGRVEEGKGLVAESLLTGAALPRRVGRGDELPAGVLLLAGKVQLTALGPAPVRPAPAPRRALTEERAERYARRVPPLALALAALTYLGTRNPLAGLSLLILGCPCAVYLAEPAARRAGLRAAERQGLVVRESGALLQVGTVDVVLFDKTGTLTAGELRLREVLPREPVPSPERVRELLAGAAGTVPGEALPLAHGCWGEVAGKSLWVGSADFLRRHGFRLPLLPTARRLEHQGRLVLYVIHGRRVVGTLGTEEALAEGAQEAVSGVRRAGVARVALVTGDAPAAARPVAEALGIAEVYAGLSPAGKAGLVRRLQAEGLRVAFVGDSPADEPALEAADVGIALARPGYPLPAAGSLVAPAAQLGGVPGLIAAGARLKETVEQNYTLAVGLSLAALAAALTGFLDPFSAAVVHNLVTLSVLANTARRHRRPWDGFQRRHPPGNAEAPGPRSGGDLLSTVPWWELDEPALVRHLGTDLVHGLSTREALRRLQAVGANRLQELPPPNILAVALRQLSDFMLLVLLGAAVVSLWLGRRGETFTIGAIILLDVVLGSWQEYRAEQAVQALRELTAPQARVLRGGEEREIPADGLVPGDVILLGAGDRVPADARLLTAAGLEVEEAALTGESVPVGKEAPGAAGAAAVADPRRSMVFLGTSVTRGRARAVVTATGMGTQLGEVTSLIQTVEADVVPLEKRLERLSRQLVAACLGLCAAVVTVGLLRGQPVRQMVLSGLSLAVGAIPEGLPTFVTISLALGVRRMIAKHAIVRRLPAVETLGCATVICSDKTGTLTCNAMTVRCIYTNGRWVKLGGEGYRPAGTLSWAGGEPAEHDEAALLLTLAAGVLASDARLVPPERPGGEWRMEGDPTEGALAVAAAKAGLDPDEVRRWAVRLAERPFESERRSMTTVVKEEAGHTFACVKGAPEVLLRRARYCIWQGKLTPLGEERRAELATAGGEMTARALRVLAVGLKPLPDQVLPAEPLPEDFEEGLILLGLVGMVDPLRPEVKAAVARCRQAGVKTVLITGDHPDTARAVAGELGLWEKDSLALTGPELEELSDAELAQLLARVVIFARALPQHKVRIVRAFKSQGYVVAMTGDGVNDAPAVKEADIGITMGRTGTEVTKQASCLILTDDNFATIVRAIEEGRATYENIRRFIRYVLTGSLAQVTLMFTTSLLGLPLPLLPTQILWVNMVTEGLPALALGADAPDGAVMRRRPRSPEDGILDGGLAEQIVTRGFLTGLATAGVFAGSLSLFGNLRRARTTAFASLAASQLLHVFECRLEGRPPGAVLGRSYLVPAVGASAGLLAAAIGIPPLQRVFYTQPLAAPDMALALLPGGSHLLLTAGRGLVPRAPKGAPAQGGLSGQRPVPGGTDPGP